jgi:nitroreductase/NAD-dependent dihydropyrimidine dehydrogenase PreA subunit
MDIFRPTVRYGEMAIDADKCTGCGACHDNCPGGIMIMGDDDVAKMDPDRLFCFTCSNCAVVCPVDAISIKSPYFVEAGFYETTPSDIPTRLPAPPLDADGNATEYTPIEKEILERRSMRNFKDDPVPDHLIRRIIEAGRMAPSAGNCQPWRFIVITDTELLDEIAGAIQPMASMFSAMYQNDDMLEMLAGQYDADPQPGMFDPRVQGGIRAVGEGELPALVGGRALIIMLGDERSIAGPELNIGICGSNMNYVANSLGLASCWVGFISLVNMNPELSAKLGVEAPYKIISSLALGYPAFDQKGMVAREAKPVAWFRPGGSGPEME